LGEATDSIFRVENGDSKFLRNVGNRLQGVITQKITNYNFITMKTSNLKQFCSFVSTGAVYSSGYVVYKIDLGRGGYLTILSVAKIVEREMNAV
jgi:hypothetical protein